MRIDTGRLTLTPFAHSDIAICQLYMNSDPALAESLSLFGRYRDREFGARRFYYDLVNPGHARQNLLYVVLRFKGYEDLPMFGIMCLKLLDAARKVWQMSYWLEEGHRKNGLMTEVSEEAIRWMFLHKKALNIYAVIAGENTESRNICARQGFRHRHDLKQGLPVWSLTSAEFLNRNLASTA